MPLFRVDPEDRAAVAETVELANAARALDDPDAPAETVDITTGSLRYGWDLEPETRYLFRPHPDAAAVGLLGLNVPSRDNRHLVEGEFIVHPEHRRQGHGAAMFADLLALVRALDRTTLWLYAAEDDPVGANFLRRRGFRYASHDARRIQYTDETDWTRLDELYAEAADRALDYRLERLEFPAPDDVVAQLVPVVAAINDAPMGDLAFEDETFDVERLRAMETAALRKGERSYQLIARRISDGAIGGHTVMVVQPRRPDFGAQYDTAVARGHRGHRLGLLLKIAMLRWLAEAEPQLKRIETWNHADNAHMIAVNEQLGYRLSRTFDAYQLVLD